MISAHDVQHAAFGRAKEGKSGYDEVAVDDFLDRAVATIEAIEQGKPAPAGALTSHDVVEAVFAEKDANTDGGYDLDDVDDLLDRVAQRLFEHEKQENQQNRAGHTSTASSGPAAPAADDPGELVDNDRADQDRVYTRDELRQPSGEPATASAQASDAGHGVTAGGTRTTVVAGAGLGAGAVAAEGVAQRDAAADTTPTDGSTGQDSTTGGRETTLSGINPAGGEAVDQHAASSADRDEVDRRNREEKVSDGVASETATSAPVAGEAKRDGVGEAAPVAQTSQAPTFGEAAAANSASESGVSGGETAQTVEQYPATDHRVPLPRGDMGAQLSDEDLRAQQNYHPEFSEYDAASAQRRADSEAAAPAESEDRTAARGADEAVAQVYNENDTTDHETPVSTVKSESESSVSSSVSSEPVAVANPTEQGKPAAGAPQVVSTQTVSVDKSEGQSLPATDAASTGTQDTTAAQTSQTSAVQRGQGGTTENVTATDNKADSVARPERIDRPEPIDRPQELPKREDKSRKGLLRRIFRG